MIRSGTDTEVLWNDARHLKPEPVYKRSVSRKQILIDNCPYFYLYILVG